MEKFFEGLCKGVTSGDQVIISGKIKKGSEEAPEEKVLHLSLLSAPKCGNSGNLDEEPYGWDSRDFIRSNVIGKVVKYTIDYKNNDRLYGQLMVDDKNLNLESARRGLCKIGFIPKGNDSVVKSDYFSKLQAAETEAKKAKVGIWNPDTNEQAAHKRKLKASTDSDFNPSEVLAFSKKEIDVIVDYVFNCSFFSVFIKPLNTYVKMNLRFVAIPNSKDTTLYKGGKAYVERLVLHKDAKAVIYGMDDSKNFIGDIFDKKGSIASYVIKNGYSKVYVNTNIPCTTEELNAIKADQKHAKKERLRLWKNEVDEDGDENEATKKEKLSGDEIGTATCIAVHSGDSISVQKSNGEVVRIFLSHIKAPNLAKPNTEEQDQPWAWQAKEFLRKFLVGKKVRCEYDYSKTVQKDNRKMCFYSVFRQVEEKGNKEATEVPKEKNVNAEVLEHGYATFVSPRNDDNEVSRHLDLYKISEGTAREKKSGLFSNKLPGVANYSDLISANKTKKKEFIHFLVNQRGLTCTIEYCFSATKLKVRIDKNKCYIPFSLIGVKSFSKDKNNTDLYDKLYNEATNFANNTILQRDGIVDIIAADRVGNYFGHLIINNSNYGTTLIKEGLGVVSQESSRNPNVHASEYKEAELQAEKNRKGIWAYEGLANILKGVEGNVNLPTKFEEKHTDITVRVTDYIDFNNFYVNVLPNKTLDKIEAVLEKYNQGSKKGSKLELPIKKGTLCVAQYPNDLRYYRAIINRQVSEGRFEVEFVDYGTVETIDQDNLIKLDGSISSYEPQSLLCEFAYLKYSQNSMKKALDTITDFVNLDLSLPGKLCYTYAQENRLKAGVVIFESEKKKLEESYHYDLLKMGYAKLDRKKILPEYLKPLQEAEKKADQAQVGIWAENEATDYDEIDEMEI